jgi:anti-anti-sigma factor
MDPAAITTPGLSLSARTTGGITIAKLNGDLDIASAYALRDQLLGLLRPGSSRLVVDLSRVGYCDASGLAVLVGTARRARLLGGFLRLAEVPPSVDRVLRITGLHGHFGVFPSIQAAATSLQRTHHSWHGEAEVEGSDRAGMHTGPTSRSTVLPRITAELPRVTADVGDLRTAVAALLTHADAWRDADPGRRFTPALQAMGQASNGTDDAALATAARSLVSVLDRYPLTHSPAVARTATRLRRVFDPVRPALT